MADDSVQQVVSAAVSSSVNPHPSMVQPRRGRKRKEKDDEGKDRAHKRKPTEDSDKLHDTVTLSSRRQEEDRGGVSGFDNRSGQTVVGQNGRQDKEKGKAGESKKIDIRI